MGEPFPSEEYRKLCIENADRLREEWEPRVGDFYRYVNHEVRSAQDWCLVDWRDHAWYRSDKRHWKELRFPLFQPRQLMEMLEERGWAWRIGRDPEASHDYDEAPFGPCEVNAARLDAILSDGKGTDDRDFVENIKGPDPETAMLRAWLEVVKDG